MKCQDFGFIALEMSGSNIFFNQIKLQKIIFNKRRYEQYFLINFPSAACSALYVPMLYSTNF